MVEWLSLLFRQRPAPAASKLAPHCGRHESGVSQALVAAQAPGTDIDVVSCTMHGGITASFHFLYISVPSCRSSTAASSRPCFQESGAAESQSEHGKFRTCMSSISVLPHTYRCLARLKSIAKWLRSLWRSTRRQLVHHSSPYSLHRQAHLTQRTREH